MAFDRFWLCIEICVDASSIHIVGWDFSAFRGGRTKKEIHRKIIDVRRRAYKCTLYHKVLLFKGLLGLFNEQLDQQIIFRFLSLIG